MEKNNMMSFSELVFNRRKEMKLTQKDIADKLFITEQAVSKWERGLSYPDISLLPKLAEILDLSAEELIYGKLNASAKKNKDSTTDVVGTLEKYKTKAVKEKSLKIFFLVVIIISVISVAAVVIVNIAVEKRLTWSLYVVGGVVLLILTIWPIVFLKGRKKAYISMVTLTIFCVPYFYLIGFLSGSTLWIKPLALPILLAGFGLAVVTTFLVTRVVKDVFLIIGINFFLGGVVFNFIAHKIINNFLENVLNYPPQTNNVYIITMAVFSFISILLFVIGFARKFVEKLKPLSTDLK